jgi:hypothetical protein
MANRRESGRETIADDRQTPVGNPEIQSKLRDAMRLMHVVISEEYASR